MSSPRVRRAGVRCLQEMEISYIPCNAYVTEGVGENWLWFLRRGGPAHRVSIEGIPRPKEFLTAGPLYPLELARIAYAASDNCCAFTLS